MPLDSMLHAQTSQQPIPTFNGIRNIVCTIVHRLASHYVCAPASVHVGRIQPQQKRQLRLSLYIDNRCDAEKQENPEVGLNLVLSCLFEVTLLSRCYAIRSSHITLIILFIIRKNTRILLVCRQVKTESNKKNQTAALKTGISLLHGFCVKRTSSQQSILFVLRFI